MLEAANWNMGILVMKVIRPRVSLDSVTPRELLNYALSLDHVTAAVIGTDSLEVLTQNVALMRRFEKLSHDEMQRIGRTLRPLFESGRLAWMQPGYTDGVPA